MTEAYNIICQTWWRKMAWTCVAASGTVVLVINDDVTAYRNGTMHS